MDDNFEIVEYKSSFLNPTEKLYVRAYLSTLSHARAHEIACGVKNGKENNFLSTRPNVQYHINNALQEKLESLEINVEEIVRRLYSEAIYREKGSNHAARVTALSLLGKHLGMFSEKQNDSEGITYNIVNYYEKEKELEEKIVDAPLYLSSQEMDNVEITNYD